MPCAAAQVGPGLINTDGKMVGQVLERLNGVSCSKVRWLGPRVSLDLNPALAVGALLCLHSSASWRHR